MNPQCFFEKLSRYIEVKSGQGSDKEVGLQHYLSIPTSGSDFLLFSSVTSRSSDLEVIVFGANKKPL